MTTAVFALAWVGVVATGASVVVRRRPARLVDLRDAARLHAATRTRAPRWTASVRVVQRGRVVLAALAPLLLVPPPLGIAMGAVAGAAVAAFPSWNARQRARRRTARIEAELPEVVDLLVLAVGAGLTVPL